MGQGPGRDLEQFNNLELCLYWRPRAIERVHSWTSGVTLSDSKSCSMLHDKPRPVPTTPRPREKLRRPHEICASGEDSLAVPIKPQTCFWRYFRNIANNCASKESNNSAVGFITCFTSLSVNTLTNCNWMTTIHPSIHNLTLYVHIKTAEQRTIIQQYGDWYTGLWWVGRYIWYRTARRGLGGLGSRPGPCPLIAVPNVTAHPSTASVRNSY